MQSLPAYVALVFVCCVHVPGSALGDDIEQVVYDALPGAGSGGIFLGLLGEYGQRVALEGAARSVTRLDVRVSVFGEGVADPSQIQLSLYDGSGSAAPPGSLLWRGLAEEMVDVDLPGGNCCGYATYVTSVPAVHVPPVVVWTISQIAEPADLLLTAVSAQAGKPTIGTSFEQVLMANGRWMVLADDAGAFTARITAIIPEPTSLLLCALVVLPVIFTNRSLSRRRH